MKFCKAGLHAFGDQAVECRIGFPHHHQPLRIAERQGAEQHGVQHRENRGVRADPQRQGNDGRQCETGILTKDA